LIFGEEEDGEKQKDRVLCAHNIFDDHRCNNEKAKRLVKHLYYDVVREEEK